MHMIFSLTEIRLILLQVKGFMIRIAELEKQRKYLLKQILIIIQLYKIHKFVFWLVFKSIQKPKQIY